MREFGTSQFVGILLGVSLMIIGYLGLVGEINNRVFLIAVGLVVLAGMSFYLGRLSK